MNLDRLILVIAIICYSVLRLGFEPNVLGEDSPINLNFAYVFPAIACIIYLFHIRLSRYTIIVGLFLVYFMGKSINIFLDLETFWLTLSLLIGICWFLILLFIKTVKSKEINNISKSIIYAFIAFSLFPFVLFTIPKDLMIVILVGFVFATVLGFILIFTESLLQKFEKQERKVLVLTIFVLSTAFINNVPSFTECKKVKEKYNNGQAKVIYVYPQCRDKAYYLRQFFYENGQLSSEGYVRKGVKEGIFKTWSEEGILTAIWDNKEGKEHGLIECWYDDGTKKREAELALGVNNGVYKNWKKDGTLDVIGFYKNGLKDSTWTYFEKFGTWWIRRYKNDTLQGETHEHLIDSIGKTIIVDGYFEKGKEHGLWKWFDKDSILTQSGIYEMGKLNGEVIRYYRNKKIRRIDLYKNDSLIKIKTAYNIKGNLTLEDGKGIIYTYYDNGQVEYIGTYSDSKRSGITKWYYDNGQLEQEAIYKNGLRMEVLSSFDRNGNKRKPGTLKDGHGTWIKYDDKGKITKINTYKNGIKISSTKLKI